MDQVKYDQAMHIFHSEETKIVLPDSGTSWHVWLAMRSLPLLSLIQAIHPRSRIDRARFYFL